MRAKGALIVAVAMSMIALAAIAFLRMSPVAFVSIDPTLTETPIPRPTSIPTPPVFSTAWVSTIDNCPSSSEYGIQVAPGANLWRTPDMRSGAIVLIPHGQKVDVYSNPDLHGMVKIGWFRYDGYVQSYLLLNYDPTTGVKPDSKNCF